MENGWDVLQKLKARLKNTKICSTRLIHTAPAAERGKKENGNGKIGITW